MPENQIKPRRSRADRALAKRMLEKLRAGDDIRHGKVRRVKSAIRARAYENSLKLAVCIDRLLEELQTNLHRREIRKR